jgi:hypothetical protein
MRLALALGWANPDAMLAEMPARVYIDWLTFARDEPFWEERADYRAALVAYTVAATTPRKKGSRVPKFEDFLLRFGPPREKQRPTGQQLFEKVKMITFFFGGSFEDKREKK